MMIGKYSPGAPALRPWDPRAANVAQMVHTLVAAQLPGVVVEHVGSTAVPGCDGKGVVDLMVLYPPGTLEATRAVLDGLGFERQHARLSFPETRPLRQGTLTYDDTPFSLHAHVLAADDDEVTEMRVWREALRTSTDMRGCYIATKHTVLDASPADGTAYALAKGVFVQNAVWALRAGVPAAALAVYPALPPLPVPAPTRTHSALVLIDTQVNMFDPASPVHDAEGLRERLAALLAAARNAKAPVLFVQNEGGAGDPDEPGTPGWEMEPRLAPLPGEPVLRKTTHDAFASTPLGAMLAAQRVRTLIVAGLQSDFCIAATVRGAAAMGVHPMLAAEGHSTYDRPAEPAKAISTRVNRELSAIAAVTPIAEIVFSEGKTRDI